MWTCGTVTASLQRRRGHQPHEETTAGARRDRAGPQGRSDPEHPPGQGIHPGLTAQASRCARRPGDRRKNSVPEPHEAARQPRGPQVPLLPTEDQPQHSARALHR